MLLKGHSTSSRGQRGFQEKASVFCPADMLLTWSRSGESGLGVLCPLTAGCLCALVALRLTSLQFLPGKPLARE